jgi:hypothetical protein
MLDREAVPAQSPLFLLCDIVDGEIILRHKLWPWDECGKHVERFRLREYAERYFTLNPKWCQQCQDKKARHLE